MNKKKTKINMGAHTGSRFSEFDLAARRTTIPLHSFLKPDELSLYYVLDRLPVRSETGLADNDIQCLLARVMGTSVDRVKYTIGKMAQMGLVVKPGKNTTYLESVIEFKTVYDLCVKLGSYPFGFGEFLRLVTDNMDVNEISPSHFVDAYKMMNASYETTVLDFSKIKEKVRAYSGRRDK